MGDVAAEGELGQVGIGVMGLPNLDELALEFPFGGIGFILDEGGEGAVEPGLHEMQNLGLALSITVEPHQLPIAEDILHGKGWG